MQSRNLLRKGTVTSLSLVASFSKTRDTIEIAGQPSVRLPKDPSQAHALVARFLRRAATFGCIGLQYLNLKLVLPGDYSVALANQYQSTFLCESHLERRTRAQENEGNTNVQVI